MSQENEPTLTVHLGDDHISGFAGKHQFIYPFLIWIAPSLCSHIADSAWLKFPSIYDGLLSVDTRLEKRVHGSGTRKQKKSEYSRGRKKVRASNSLPKFTQLVRARVGLNAGSVKAVELQKLSL